MTTIDAKTRAEIARGWARSSLSQDEYAARHAISPRTLRLWISRYASRHPPLDQVRAIIGGAVQQLRDLLDALEEVEPDAACRPILSAGQEPVAEADGHGPNDEAVSALITTACAKVAELPVSDQAASPRQRARAGSFFAAFDDTGM